MRPRGCSRALGLLLSGLRRIRFCYTILERSQAPSLLEKRMSTDGRLTICQISDIHCGSVHFIPDLLERSILEINDLEPTAEGGSGDLTGAGNRPDRKGVG